MSQSDYLDVEIHLLSRTRVRLRCPDQQEYSGRACLDDELFGRLLEMEHTKDFSGYGQALFEAVFPIGGELSRGIYSVLDHMRKEEKRLRLRLNIDRGVPSEIHGLHWELLTDGKEFEVGRSPETVFSRYIPRPHIAVPAAARPKMLCVIAAPIDVHRYDMAPIDYDYAFRQLEKSFKGLEGGLEIDFFDRPATPERLRIQLKKKRYDMLHVHGHGILPRQGEAALVFEDADHKVNFATESALRDILLGLRHLKLVTLVACHGGEQSEKDNLFSGLAGSLVQQNVPAVIAMRRAISMKVGFRFTEYFYRQLAETPCVDAAINEARHQLYMDNPEGIDWSSPVLYMRLEDGLLLLPPRLTTGPRKIGKPLDRYRLSALFFALLLMTAVIKIAFYVQAKNSLELFEPHLTSMAAAGPTDLPADDTIKDDKPEVITEPPPEPISFAPILPRTIGVGAIDGAKLTWDAPVSQILARWLRTNADNLEVIRLPSMLHGNLAAIASGDLSVLPGGDQSPNGLNYLFLMVATHGPHAAARSTFPTVSVHCEMILIDSRSPRVVFDNADSHLGQGVTKTAALEQAFDRCLQGSIAELDGIT